MSRGRRRASRHTVVAGILSILTCWGACSAQGASTAMADAERARADEASRVGDFASAAACWERAARGYREAGKGDAAIGATVLHASALASLGEYRSALTILAAAPAGNHLASARIGNAKASLKLRLGEPAEAAQHLADSLPIAQRAQDVALEAEILENQGAVSARVGEHAQAVAQWLMAGEKALDAGEPVLAARAFNRAASVTLSMGDDQQAERFNQRSASAASAFPGDSYEKAFALVSIGLLDQHLAERASVDRTSALQRSHGHLLSADRIARNIGNPRMASYACGHLAQLYRADGQDAEALRLTRRAVFEAQRAQAPESLYRWEWQLARLLLTDPCRQADALSAYARAVKTLQTIRHDIALDYGSRGPGHSFRKTVGPLYYEYADLQLLQSGTVSDRERLQQALLDACDTIETLKSAEIEDYFQDRCTNVLRAKEKRIDLGAIVPGTAVLYVIPLANRIEVLLSTSRGVTRTKPVEVSAVKLDEVADNFRIALEDRTTYDYISSGKQLYQWLIAPIERQLREQQIDTLVFVPDGVLRTIPMAALTADGKRHLIDDYAVAITPGLKLMEPKPIERRNVRVLGSGLSIPADKSFAPLPFVPGELSAIQDLYGGQKLLDQDFRLNRLEREITDQPYAIVHIASHGQFSSDSKKTFLLAYDERLSLDKLERLIQPSQFRQQPVELLTLSACQTAAGDDRAALGLAGVAIKAGARSAMATLWFVNDEASSDLVRGFYTALHQDPKLSKAKALQRAQQLLIKDPRYSHPCYWSPYLIIGNWL